MQGRDRESICEGRSRLSLFEKAGSVLGVASTLAQVYNIAVLNAFWPFYAAIVFHLLAAMIQFVRIIILPAEGESWRPFVGCHRPRCSGVGARGSRGEARPIQRACCGRRGGVSCRHENHRHVWCGGDCEHCFAATGARRFPRKRALFLSGSTIFGPGCALLERSKKLLRRRGAALCSIRAFLFGSYVSQPELFLLWPAVCS